MAALKTRESQGPEAELLGQMAGEYRIGRRLGIGGFGAVYEAEHPVLKRRAAVKVLHAGSAVDSVAVQRFIEEARAASRIRHRHVIDIFSFGQLKNGQYFYVMDLLEGAGLDAYLKEHGRLAPAPALQLLRAVASALDALHGAGLVHRDVKPANIFLAFEEETHEVVPKLLDLGLVKLMRTPSVHTASGVPLGTPYYMSPEQCRGDQVDARADIYSFGVVCFEVLTGKRPFVGDSSTAVLVAHLTQPPPPMSQTAPELNPVLDGPVLRMLAKEPNARPSSAGAAFEELARAAREAGLAPGDGLPWLPRPSSEAPPESFGSAATVHQSGMRDGTRATAEGRRMGLWVGAVLFLAIGLFAALRFSARPAPAAPKSEPAAGSEATPVATQPAERAPAAAAVPPTTAQPAQPAPAQPGPPARRVSLRLRGAPNGAVIFLGDQRLGEAPGPIALPYGEEPVELRVVAPGRGPRTLRVTPSVALDVVLPPEPGPRPRPKRGAVSRDLENPF